MVVHAHRTRGRTMVVHAYGVGSLPVYGGVLDLLSQYQDIVLLIGKPENQVTVSDGTL